MLLLNESFYFKFYYLIGCLLYGSGDTYENILLVSFRLLGDAVIIPRFPEPVNNVTVVAGRDAVLSCSVDNLHKFKVRHWQPKEGITSKLGLSQI